MIELGRIQTLTVKRVKEFGVYLGEGAGGESTGGDADGGDGTGGDRAGRDGIRRDGVRRDGAGRDGAGRDGAGREAAVLLPKRQVPEGTKTGDEITVFIYKDSEDRLIATTGKPSLTVGGTGVLPVKEVGKIGAFLDMGLEKDLLLPFKEQTHQVCQGEEVLVALYVDKSQRLAATMRVYSHLSSQSPYQKDDQVSGIIYELSDTLGAFVAVDNRYYGLIPKKELYQSYQEGEKVTARVVKVREDGKLDLSPRQKAYLQMDEDSDRVLLVMEERFGGVLPFTDKTSPDIIKREFQMSKNAFKRAVGRLLKDGRVKITGETIEIVK